METSPSPNPDPTADDEANISDEANGGLMPSESINDFSAILTDRARSNMSHNNHESMCQLKSPGKADVPMRAI